MATTFSNSPIMKRAQTALILITLLLALAPAARAQQGYFRVEQRDGAWWFIDPAGTPVLSQGVDTIRYEGDRIHGNGAAPYLEAVKQKYVNHDAWETSALARLRSWGFNTIGAWSDAELWRRDMPYTVILDIADKAGANWQYGRPVDVYDPRFERAAQEAAAQECAPRAHDPLLVGYFSDNELRWGADWRGKETMLDMYLALPASAPGHVYAVNFLRHRYSDDLARFNQAWQTAAADFSAVHGPSASDAHQADSDAFLALVAARYFRVSADAIHNADPAHLYLGARFAGRVPDAVLEGARAADVVSVNIYSFDPRPLVEHIYQVTGKPVLITEFAFRAENAGLPNTRGAGPKVPDQAARARAYADYVTRLESLPEAVGYHWFEWSDEPKEGRFDGENSNYGFVNIQDDVYEEFAQAARVANQAALEAHRKSAQP